MGAHAVALCRRAGLDRCLDVLGPPRFVWKDPRGVWLAYVWIHERTPSFGVSVPTEGLLPSPGISYSSARRRGTGVVVNLDGNLAVRFVRRGLTDLPPD